jgi:hypothetical protein
VRSKITSCPLPTTSQAWRHVVAAIFTIGPGTAAIMSTPRYIRKRNIIVVGYLYRITRICVLASLLTLILGLIITQLPHLFSKPWISMSAMPADGTPIVLVVWNGG